MAGSRPNEGLLELERKGAIARPSRISKELGDAVAVVSMRMEQKTVSNRNVMNVDRLEIALTTMESLARARVCRKGVEPVSRES